jgi:hypothetical protein
MLSEALQRNAKREAGTFKHLWIFCLVRWEEIPEILRSAQDDDLVTGRWRFESRPFPQV